MDPLSIAAVGWLMSALVSKAVTVLLEAWTKRIGLGNEFKTLQDQLLQLGALLTSSRGFRNTNNFLEQLVQNLQQLAYQAENLLDELDYYRLEDKIQDRDTQVKVNCNNESSVASSSSGFRLASRSIISTWKGMSCCFARDELISLPETLSSRINLSRRMKELAEQLQKYEEKVRHALQTESLVIIAQNTEICQTEATSLRQTSSFLTEPKIFGRDQDRDQLMNLLTNEESAIVGNVPVLAIVGCGGVGKTTLARLVFKDPKIHSHFEVRLWICVSTLFDSMRITREMLEGACGTRCDELINLNELQNKLKDKLGSKRFLLVLDDMWEDKDKSQWDSIVAPLNYGRVQGSKILVTTRNQSVVKMIDARDFSLQGLDENVFLSFFSTCIFNDPNFKETSRLRNIGQQIANKLMGNPLAAKTVGALLKENCDERYWMKIRDSEEWKSQSGPNDIMPALRLSYENMSYHLQRCFSYCAIFSKHHSFTCKELIYLWMAQGFLDVKSEGKVVEDIGSSYFDDLFNRGFFQTKESTYGGLAYYTFHDLIHDLACMVSFKECLTINGTKPRQILPTIRHLLIFGSWPIKMFDLEEAIVRALACLEGENISTIMLTNFPDWNEWSSGTFQNISDLFKETKFLRALTTIPCSQHSFNFQNFFSLRYLRLIKSSYNNCENLPRGIWRLYHLEVFQLEGWWSLDDLPNEFSDLISLRHFIVERGLMLHNKIWSVGKLTSLQELNYFDVQENIGFEIEQLGSLKEIGGSLQISNLENVKSKREASKARLEEKEKLDILHLQWNHGEQGNESVLEGLKPNTNLKCLTIVGYGGVTSPKWLEPSLIFLKSLTLKGCKVWELLPPIGELEFLKHLKMSGLAVREIGPQCYGTHQSTKFPSLEELEIIDFPNLKKWVWSDQLQQFICYKKLKTLTIQGCCKLVYVPLSGCSTSEVLERFPSLNTLNIGDCPLIFRLAPLPLISNISIERTGFIKRMFYGDEYYVTERRTFSLILDNCSCLELGELLAFHVLTSVSSLEISCISGMESLDLRSFVSLVKLVIKGCQSLTSLTFGEHCVHLRCLEIVSCKTLSSIKGLNYWVNLENLYFLESPGFIAAWDSASKEIERTEPSFSLSLKELKGDTLAPLTLPICKQLTSLKFLVLEISAYTEEHGISLQLLTSIDLVDIRGCKTIQAFPFDLFPSLKTLTIKFPRIPSLPINSRNEIIEGCLKLRHIKKVHVLIYPVQMDAVK